MFTIVPRVRLSYTVHGEIRVQDTATPFTGDGPPSPYTGLATPSGNALITHLDLWVFWCIVHMMHYTCAAGIGVRAGAMDFEDSSEETGRRGGREPRAG